MNARPLIVLGLAAVVGALAAHINLLDDSAGRVADDSVVATVNGTTLEMAEYQRAVRLFASEKRSPVTPQDRALILERMIEEELLLQYGVEEGLVRSDAGVRAEVLRAVVSSLLADLEASAELQTDGADDLAEYLRQLRDGATIRRVAAGTDS